MCVCVMQLKQNIFMLFARQTLLALSLRMQEGMVISGKSQELGHVKIGVCCKVEHPEICKSCYD